MNTEKLRLILIFVCLISIFYSINLGNDGYFMGVAGLLVGYLIKENQKQIKLSSA